MSKQKKAEVKAQRLAKIVALEKTLISLALRSLMIPDQPNAKQPELTKIELVNSFGNKKYKLALAVKPLWYTAHVDISKKGRFKMRAELKDVIKRRIKNVLVACQDELILAPEGKLSYEDIDSDQWKKLRKSAGQELRKMFILAAVREDLRYK